MKRSAHRRACVERYLQEMKALRAQARIMGISVGPEERWRNDGNGQLNLYQVGGADAWIEEVAGKLRWPYVSSNMRRQARTLRDRLAAQVRGGGSARTS